MRYIVNYNEAKIFFYLNNRLRLTYDVINLYNLLGLLNETNINLNSVYL